VVLPSVKLEEMAGLAEKPPVQPSNQAGVAHVYFGAGTTTGAVFWQKGTAGAMAVDGAAVLYSERSGDGQIVSMANPLHQTKHLNAEGEYYVPKGYPAKGAPSMGAMVQDWSVAKALDGRVDRTGFRAKVEQQPHEDLSAISGYKVEATTEGELTVLSVTLPEKMRKDWKVVVRGPQGHLRAEFGEGDVVSRVGDVVRLKWVRKAGGGGPKPEKTFGVTLFGGIWQASATIQIP
jgi:hypothetical protein